MNEPAREPLPGAGAAVFVPRRITGPVLAGGVPGQPLALVHRAAELAYALNVKLIWRSAEMIVRKSSSH